MIFVFVEDATLEIIDGVADAQQSYEGLDVESGVYRFYDETGCFLEPQFHRPNRSGRYFGIIPWVEHGEFDLVPNSTLSDDSIMVCLSETETLMPNPWFETLDEVREFLRKS